MNLPLIMSRGIVVFPKMITSIPIGREPPSAPAVFPARSGRG